MLNKSVVSWCSKYGPSLVVDRGASGGFRCCSRSHYTSL